MALRNRSLFLYAFTIDSTNSSLDFSVNGGSTLLATLKQGFYTLNSLMTEVVRAMAEQAPTETFSYEIDRSILGGLENRVKIKIAVGTITLLFGSGPRKNSSVALTIGFNPANVTGAEVSSNFSAGTSLVSSREGYTFLAPEYMRRVRGSVNVSASGVKEAIVYEVQQFTQVEFKHEPESKVITEWRPLMEWLIQQRPVEFTPNYETVTETYEVTLEKTAFDGAGLGYQLTEMLPELPFYYRTGMLTFRRSLGPYAVLVPQGVPTGGGGGGGGGGTTNVAAGSTLGWYAGPDYPPLEAEENSQFVYLFGAGEGAVLNLDIRVPQEYATGTQIFLYLSQYSQSGSGTQKLQTTAYLVRAGVDTPASTANAHASTNTALTNSVPFMLRTVALDLTNSSGQINGLSPAPGDIIRVVLSRGGDTDSAPIRLIPSATGVSFG